MASRYRGWCFTVNNYKFSDMCHLMDMHFEYMIIAYEVGKKGTPHIQGYVYFHNGITFETAKKKLPKDCHIERQKGTPEQATIYCMKDGEYYEFGERPCQGKAKFEQIKSVMENPEENFHLYNQYRRSYREYMLSKKKDHERNLYFIHEDKRYTIEGEVFHDLDLETYENEDIIVIPPYSSFKVDAWINGYPPRIKRGYEIIKIDPTDVYITYETDKELNYLKKKYVSIGYSCLINEDPLVLEEQLNEDPETPVDDQ